MNAKKIKKLDLRTKKVSSESKFFQQKFVETNQDLQTLLKDLQLHPERYIHFSVIGGKTKGANFTPEEEKDLKKVVEERKGN